MFDIEKEWLKKSQKWVPHEIVVNNKHQVAHRTIEIESSLSLSIFVCRETKYSLIYIHTFEDLGLDITFMSCLILIG